MIHNVLCIADEQHGKTRDRTLSFPPDFRQQKSTEIRDPAYFRAKKKMRNRSDYAFRFGGPEGDRTLDLRVANAALSQLSYEPD